MSLSPHVGVQYLCACPPSAIKGEACDVTTQAQALDPILEARELYLTEWSRVLGSGGPNHSKSLCVLVFFPFSQLISETPKPLLILGFRAGALRHPVGDLLSDTI
jgi:ubiquinone/menaquinone biosynthesis C-methylase UbiE